MTGGAEWRVGDSLPELRLPPVGRMDLIRYAGASGDYNPIHLIDEEAARAGLPGVIQHGMLTMGQMGRLLSPYLDRALVRHFAVRFTGMVLLDDELVLTGRVEEVEQDGVDTRVRLDLSADTVSGRRVAAGTAELLVYGSRNNAS